MLDFEVGASCFEIAKGLRHIVGQRVSEKPPEEFLDLMLTWALSEKNGTTHMVRWLEPFAGLGRMWLRVLVEFRKHPSRRLRSRR